MNVDLNIKGDIEVLRLQPGDVIVISIDESLTPHLFDEFRDEVRAQLKERFPGHEVIFTNGVTLAIQREEVAA